ncbi:MAG: hypothetical protein NZ879_08550 [Archaeoglobaceae archaeon]|nr:hypothetical protein [Archaeoglobaceae archaeon]MDW7990421.1 hypothetical protein [Archaeoglobaceae archaeon]MDW8119013.1 hypothetical protein [Archaeoglobaceae archaeon]
MHRIKREHEILACCATSVCKRELATLYAHTSKNLVFREKADKTAKRLFTFAQQHP